MINRIKNKVSFLNVLSSILLQIFTIISGFIVPKIILSVFGSDINGLLSSLKQFLSYITIIEGGISGIIVANLYKPIIDNNHDRINKILKTADSFYKTIGLIYIIYSLLLAITYPLVIKTEYSFIFIFSITLLLSFSLLIQYLFSQALKGLLIADKKIYIISFVQIIIIIANTLLIFLVSKIFPNIHLLTFITGFLYILQPLFFGIYIKKHYNLNLNVKKDKSLIKERWNGFAINIASFIHNSTDISILTIFTNLRYVSVYSIYALVTSGIKQLVNSVATSLTPTIGQAYAKKDLKALYLKMDLYEYIVDYLVFMIFSITILLITPFVLLYTKGITDINYNQSLFGILLVVSEIIYLIKLPHLNLAYSANKFKDLTKPAFIEAFLNIIISIFFVKKYGLIGVTLGTIIAMTYRLIFHIFYTKKLINRSQVIFYKKIFIFIISSIVGYYICYSFFPIINITITSWVFHSFIYVVIFFIIFSLTSIVFFKNELKYIFKYFNLNLLNK